MKTKKTVKKILITLITLFSIYFIIFGIVLISSKTKNKKNKAELQTTKTQEQKTIIPKNLYSIFSPKFGNKDAIIRVVMFIDFDCAFCRDEYFILRNIMEKYKEKVFFEFRNMPLESIHENSRELANIAMCSKVQGKFWEMFDELFLNFNERSNFFGDLKNIYKNYAKNANIELSNFEDCVKNKQFDKIINKDILDGISLNVSGTPTFFINGVKFKGVLSMKKWETIFSRSVSMH